MEVTGSNNPFNGIDVGFYSTPDLGDVDGDGDLDAVVGEVNGDLKYYQNQGTASNPNYVEVTGSNNPFNGIDVGVHSAPTLAYVDGDGDLDAVVGEFDGTLNYFFSELITVFPEVTGSNNPFNGIDVGLDSTVTLADVDGDGDLDVVVGETNGTLNYYQNQGTATNPNYVELTDSNNPFNGIDVGRYSTPDLADVDGDGDLDAVVGELDGILNYYQNQGTASNPNYVELTGSNNPFNGIDVGIFSTPDLGDVDGDGDLDAVVGESDGNLKYYQNQGTATNPNYVELTGSNNPFNGIDVGFYSAPTLGDIDGDGDLDVVVGESDGNLFYFQNQGTATNPNYVELTGSNNPFNGLDVGRYSTPTFADVDGDGDLDAVVGENSGTLNYLQNPILGSYQEVTGSNNPFNGIDVGTFSTPTFADVDGDGDLDAVVGENSGTLNYFQNNGSATNPNYVEVTGSNNPFNGIDVGSFSTPDLGDVDGDGDLDAVVGESNGNLKYYQNNGSATNPNYVEVTGSNNPFNGLDVGLYSTHTLADVDGDGDLDAVLGETNGTLKYYQNQGTAINPNYVELTGSNNPFDGIDVATYSTPTLADVDGDGDLDAVVGEVFGTLNYYQNQGTATNPNYVELTGSNNPFNGFDVGSDSNPTLADVNGDGILEALVGGFDGVLNYFEFDQII